jgi:hypothetical protein
MVVVLPPTLRNPRLTPYLLLNILRFLPRIPSRDGPFCLFRSQWIKTVGLPEQSILETRF